MLKNLFPISDVNCVGSDSSDLLHPVIKMFHVKQKNDRNRNMSTTITLKNFRITKYVSQEQSTSPIKTEELQEFVESIISFDEIEITGTHEECKTVLCGIIEQQ